MTQIAATVASATGKHHAGKSHAGKEAAGADFASVVAGLGLGTEEEGAADADAFALNADETRSDGKSVVLDLGLDAAAKSAGADMVVAMQTGVQPMATATVTDAPKTDTAVTLEGRGTGRPAWHRPDAAPVKDATGEGTQVTDDIVPRPGADVVPIASRTAKAVKGTPLPADKAAPEKTSTKVADDAPQASASATATPVEGASDKTRTPRLKTGVQTGAAFRQAAREAAQPVTANATDKTTPSQPVSVQAATILTVPGAKQAVQVPAAAPQLVTGKPADPAAQAAATEVSTPLSAVPVSAAPTGRPVMSALHRAAQGTNSSTGAGTDAVAAQAPQIAQNARSDAETSPDQGQSQDKAASAVRMGDSEGASAADGMTSSGTQFSDILQSLPPMAQSRLGLVTDASPVVTGPADVGATLQGQVIDMGVDGQWIDRMAKEITALADGTGHSRFQLNPPNLGRIQIDVWHGENGGQVQLLTETDEAAQRLRDGKTDLQADARLASLSLQSITIERSSAGFDGGRDPNPQNSPNSQNNPRHQQGGSEQSTGQSATQTGTQDGGRGSGQAAAQANAQGGSHGGSQGQQNSGGQGKSPWSRDVLNERAGTMAQDGASARRNGDRLVRYA